MKTDFRYQACMKAIKMASGGLVLALFQHGAEGEDRSPLAGRVPPGGAILRLHVSSRDGREFLGKIDIDPMGVELRRHAARL